ncbi:hypothetical protein Tco_0075025, partial [Tanacetum coccineum]
MRIQDMEDPKQQYLDEMKSLINTKDYRDEKIDIKFNELKENFNEMSIEINKKKKLQQLEQVRILQKSQENGQNRTNTNTGMERAYKNREFDSKK